MEERDESISSSEREKKNEKNEKEKRRRRRPETVLNYVQPPAGTGTRMQ